MALTDNLVVDKQCTKCLLIKALDEFGPSKLGRYGRNSRCRLCKRSEYRACAEVRKLKPKIIPETKRCRKCGLEKSSMCFSRDARSNDGIFIHCKDCASADHREYHKAHAEHLRAKALARYDREYCAEVRSRKPEHYRQYYAEWHRRNKDRRNKAAQARYYADPSGALDRSIKRRAAKRETQVSPVRRRDIWNRDHGVCFYCKSACDPKGWHLAHIVALSNGGPHIPENVAVSHPLCNWKAGVRQ